MFPRCKNRLSEGAFHDKKFFLSLAPGRPGLDPNLMKPGPSLYEITSRVLPRLNPLPTQWRADTLRVYGDNSTTFATSPAPFYRHIPVGRIKAGLRTGSCCVPRREEANRQLTSALAQCHLAPTATSRGKLPTEGADSDKIFVTDHTAIDAPLQTCKKTVTTLPCIDC